jgi:hypothetical protein
MQLNFLLVLLSFIAGTAVAYAFILYNTGNVKLRGMQLLVPALAGNSNDSSIACTFADSTSWTHGSDLAAGSSLSCAGSFSFDQDAIEAGDRSPAVTATAANLAAAVSQPLPAISVPNTPSLAVTVDTTSCSTPNDAGENMPCSNNVFFLPAPEMTESVAATPSRHGMC